MLRRVGVGLILALTASCAQPSWEIRTEPYPSEVYIDGEPVGPAPVELDFDHYGTRRVDLRAEAEDGRVWWHTEFVELATPWYRWFPLDLVTDLLWPFGEHVEVAITIPPPEELDDTARARMLERAAALRTELR